MIKRVFFTLLLAGALVPLASAQKFEHIQIGVFAEDFHPIPGNLNFGGLGARVGFMGYKNLMFEAEMSYDFDQIFTESFSNGVSIRTARTGLRVLHGEFGPKINLGHWPIHPFLTLKGGGIDYRIDNAPATFGTFTSSVANLRANNVNGVLYPGGGIEGHLGPIGLRAEIGDDIVFNHGAHNNIRVSFGPYIRF